jgi:hypothetical protein
VVIGAVILPSRSSILRFRTIDCPRSDVHGAVLFNAGTGQIVTHCIHLALGRMTVYRHYEVPKTTPTSPVLLGTKQSRGQPARNRKASALSYRGSSTANERQLCHRNRTGGHGGNSATDRHQSALKQATKHVTRMLSMTTIDTVGSTASRLRKNRIWFTNFALSRPHGAMTVVALDSIRSAGCNKDCSNCDENTPIPHDVLHVGGSLSS